MKLTTARAATMFTAALGAAALVAAPAQASVGSQPRQMHEQGHVGGMHRMHDMPMMQGNRGMGRMHELRMQGNPGMQRMHEAHKSNGHCSGGMGGMQ